MGTNGRESRLARSSLKADPDRWLKFLGSWGFPWLVLAGMVAAYLATSAVDASGPRTSFAIGIAGAVPLGFLAVYGWWAVIRTGLRGQRLSRGEETRVWTGLTSTLKRWLSVSLSLIGWLGMLVMSRQVV